MRMTITEDGAASESMAFLQDVLSQVRPRDFCIRLWDGTTWEPEPGQQARFTLVLKHPGSLRAMFSPPDEVTLGEAYIYDDFDVEGDLEATASLGERLGVLDDRLLRLGQYAVRLARLPAPQRRQAPSNGSRLRGRAHSRERDRGAIRYHYDVSNEFYQQFLDGAMVYSCGYFPSPSASLTEAQSCKLDHICRKLRLRPGERVLDIGCGWGGLAMHAARAYGVEVLGITLSEEQARLANERITGAGLADRCRVEVRDYRDVDESQLFDKLVSVGMFEHVGAALLPTYFAKAFRLLHPGGVFVNHGISVNAANAATRGPSFSEKYVFPDGELLPVSRTLAAAEDAGFEVRDLENLREHYAMTLRSWVRNLEEHAEEAKAATDETTYRIWRLFMTFSAIGFSRNTLQVHQTLLAKPDKGRSGLPLTRADWYA